jgi:hypothetical protein
MSPSGSFASVLILAFAAIAYCRPYAGRHQPESKGKDERHSRSHAAFDDSLIIPLPVVIAQMFEWDWDSVARECTNFLGPAGYGFVQGELERLTRVCTSSMLTVSK